MKAEPDRPGPIDCAGRGLRSLRANWELVLVVLGQSLLTTGLMIAGLFVLLAAFGVSVVAWVRDLGPGWPQQLAEDLVATLESTPPPILPLIPPLIAATLVWTVAFGLYCYLQGGVVGLLAEGEMAAGAGRPGWRSFRSFSLGGLDRHGRRLFWRYFWFNHLLGAVALVWMLFVLLLVALSAGLATSRDPSIGVASGCLGLVPLLLVLLAAGLWSMLATVELARPGAGVWDASLGALCLLRHHPGPVIVIWLLAMAGWMALNGVFMPIKLAVAMAARDMFSVWIGARGVLMLVELVLNSALVVALIATVVALIGLDPAEEQTGTGR